MSSVILSLGGGSEPRSWKPCRVSGQYCIGAFDKGYIIAYFQEKVKYWGSLKAGQGCIGGAGADKFCLNAPQDCIGGYPVDRQRLSNPLLPCNSGLLFPDYTPSWCTFPGLSSQSPLSRDCQVQFHLCCVPADPPQTAQPTQASPPMTGQSLHRLGSHALDWAVTACTGEVGE